MEQVKRLIDADALKAQFDDFPPFMSMTGGCVQQFIDKAPSVDAVDALEYDAIVNKLECLLCHATGGQYSKAGYSLEDMERMVTDYIEECCEEAVAEAVVRCEQCRHWDELPSGKICMRFGYCSKCSMHTAFDHFCSFWEG